MVRQRAREAGKSRKDPRFAFDPGGAVLLRQRRPNKLTTKCTGPYRFLKYLNKSRTTAQIECVVTGKRV